jgi:hypothetical protein
VLQLVQHEIQLTQVAAADDGASDEWGEFLHLPGQKFFDFAEIEAEIVRETEKATGRNKVCGTSENFQTI